jgi:AbrB family looped-hinge helix DNA binding protein
MTRPATTKMTSKGQVVIPEEVRKRLGLKPGIRFIVVGKKDVVILKAIQLPDLEEFGTLIAEAHKQARRGGLRHSDVAGAVTRVRRAG